MIHKSLSFALGAMLYLSHAMASGTGSDTLTRQVRAADTCGDPQTSITYFQGYSATNTAHLVTTLGPFVNSANLGDDWVIQNSIFRAWATPQPGTVQLFYLFNSANPDNMYLLANADGSLPSAPGYTLRSPVIWVYPTQVCGSVPLFAMYRNVSTDHFYSIDPTEPARMVQWGYQSQGIVAYVLPLDCGCGSA